jgi:hypothetical protein
MLLERGWARKDIAGRGSKAVIPLFQKVERVPFLGPTDLARLPKSTAPQKAEFPQKYM